MNLGRPRERAVSEDGPYKRETVRVFAWDRSDAEDHDFRGLDERIDRNSNFQTERTGGVAGDNGSDLLSANVHR